ncbi:MAG: T9SS type A sorting domain-containing protein [Ignavibacteria bacterium]|jgi:Zn-dependent metalloprotease|nr:T9SS type A sorting domain-containing protein [Ignavibacteria bacterium]
MEKKLGFLLFLLFLLLTDISGHNLEGKRTHKKNYSHPGSVSLMSIGRNLNSFLQRNGLSAGIKTYSFAPGQMNMNLPLPGPGASDNPRKIFWNKESGTPRYIEFNSSSNSRMNRTVPKGNLSESTANFLMENKTLLKIKDPANEFRLTSQKTDQFSMSHLKYIQTYRGLEVWAREIIVHLDNAGRIISMNGIYEPTPEMIADVKGSVSSSRALEEAMSDLRGKTAITEFPPALAKIIKYNGPVTKKIIWHDRNHIPHLAWFVEIRADLSQDWYYFIDAGSGDILHSYNNISYDGPKTGSGKDLDGVQRTFPVYQFGTGYFLADASEPMYNDAMSVIPDGMIGAIVSLDLRNNDFDGTSPLYFVTSEGNEWNDPAAVSAHYNAILTYKYFLNFCKRNSIDDNGMTIYSTVHVTSNGESMDNAFWSGMIMCYGDGGSSFKPLAGALDVAAHEMTHGITQYSAGLEYQYQSGALNESFSDVFGALVDTLNWQMGETIVKDFQEFPAGCLRDMSNPHNGASEGEHAWQPENMSEFVQTDGDNGGVHTNSGIPNYAFCKVARSLGRSEAGMIWYRALTLYLTKSSQFTDARIATERAAADLFGENSPQLQQVKNAWEAVGVKEDGGTPPPPPSTLEGAEWILMTNTEPSDPNSIYMAKTTITSNSDFFALSQTPVSNRPAVSDATGLVVFVDQNNNLRALLANPDNTQETILDSSGVWGSVAIGPGLTSLALTSMYQDTTIYYIDLINQTYKAFKIATKSYDAADAKTALYADELSFEPSGKFLLFDAYNELKQSTGGTLSFWNINLLNIETGYMEAVFPPQSEGISVANPSFSKTSTTRFTFDYIDENKKQDYVRAADFNTGNVATVAGPLPVIGYPTYSANDRTIAFHNTGTISGITHQTVDQIALKSNFLEPDGPGKPYVIDATYPTWFVIGKRDISPLASKETLPAGFMLMQNFPNPFNPSASICYEVPQEGFVELKVFDILGKEVTTLVNEVKGPGRYTVSFNSQALSLPSGIYLYRLSQGQNSASKKMIIMK